MDTKSPLDWVALVLHWTEEKPKLSTTRTSYDYEKDRTWVTHSSTSNIQKMRDLKRWISQELERTIKKLNQNTKRHVIFILAQTRNFALQTIHKTTGQLADVEFNSDLYDINDMARLWELSQQGIITLKTRVFRGDLVTDNSKKFDPHTANQEQFWYSTNVELTEAIVEDIATKLAQNMRATRTWAGNFIHTGKSGPDFLPNRILQDERWRHIFWVAFCRTYWNGHVCIKTEEDDRSPFYADVLAALGANRVHPGKSQLVYCHTA